VPRIFTGGKGCPLIFIRLSLVILTANWYHDTDFTLPGRSCLRFLIFVAAVVFSNFAGAQSVPAAIFSDPPADASHPAGMEVLHIPSHGVVINGLEYIPSGPGPHPTLVICHGLPGNEKNLDLAQAVRRAGWNAVTFNYRGSWGSPGVFRFTQISADADAVLAFLRDPANTTRLGIDPKRIVIAGHSMGGWVTARTAAHDHELIGAILISASDVGSRDGISRKDIVDSMSDDMETLTGVTAESMADELIANAQAFSLDHSVSGLVQMPLLVLSADDGLAPSADKLVKAIGAKGGRKVTAVHAATDHSWSDHRIFLEVTVINWLTALK
jgi:pimeloyl-ACP methyl ester carboxylesterase